MTDKQFATAIDYITPLNINGMNGRMLRTAGPKDKKRNIVLVYGHHPSLERWWGLVENFKDYGSVTMPDLPGFGGMDSFYKVGGKPDIDAYADYLADFVNLKFKDQSITLVGVSFGFVVLTRMLQRHPEMIARVELLVSLTGFMHKDDFRYSKPRRQLYAVLARVFATKPLSLVIKHIILNSFVMQRLYMRMPSARRRMAEVPLESAQAAQEFDAHLWKINDVRTHWQTINEFFRLDNCSKPINIPVIHVNSKGDNYFNNDMVRMHMLEVFSSYKGFTTKSLSHVPSIISGKEEAGVLLPDGLRKILAS